MKTITLEEYGKDAVNIHKRVEKGEKIAVTDGQVQVVLTPTDEYVRMHTTGGSAETCPLDLNSIVHYNLKVNQSKQ